MQLQDYDVASLPCVKELLFKEDIPIERDDGVSFLQASHKRLGRASIAVFKGGFEPHDQRSTKQAQTPFQDFLLLAERKNGQAPFFITGQVLRCRQQT